MMFHVLFASADFRPQKEGRARLYRPYLLWRKWLQSSMNQRVQSKNVEANLSELL